MLEKFKMYELLPLEKRYELEKRVDDFFKEKNIVLNEKTDITGVCKKLGILVLSLSFAAPLNNQIHGIIYVDGDDKKIGVNSNLNSREARFVVAHELSHYITKSISDHKTPLLFGNADSKFDSNETKPIEEREMDYMAAAILVRKSIFEDDLKMLDISDVHCINDVENQSKIDSRKIEMLAERFNVMEDVIKRRILEVLQ